MFATWQQDTDDSPAAGACTVWIVGKCQQCHIVVYNASCWALGPCNCQQQLCAKSLLNQARTIALQVCCYMVTVNMPSTLFQNHCAAAMLPQA